LNPIPSPAPGDPLQAAFAAHRAGRLEEAERLYRDLLAGAPEDPELLHHLGMVRQQQGAAEEGLALIRRAIATRPEEARFRFNLASILAALRRPQEAEAAYAEASRAVPGDAAQWLAQGRAELERGQPVEAAHYARLALAAGAQGAEARLLLGEAALARRRGGEAERAFNEVLAAHAGDLEALCGAGRALLTQGRAQEGRSLLERARAIDPTHPGTQLTLAGLAIAAGETRRVEELLEPVVKAHPEHGEARFRLAAAYAMQGRLAEAEPQLRHAVAIDPKDARFRNDLAGLLLRLKRLEEALAEAQAAQRLDPELPEVYANLGGYEVLMQHFEASERWYRQALSLNPDQHDVRNNLANSILRQCRIEEAWEEYREVLRRFPGHWQAHSNLLLTLNYRDQPLAEFRAEHERYWQMHGVALPRPARYPNDPDPERRLRIGFVAGHITTTPVHVFMRPIFEHYDRERLAVYCYDTDAPDERVQRFKGLLEGWQDVEGLSFSESAALIAEDRIDILVDLMGHMGQTRILLFALKPAPVQASYMGYLNTTGFASMDAWISDAVQNPPETQAWFTERLVCLPRCFVAYAPADGAPAPAAPPLLQRGAVTFGCYNNPNKLSPRAVRVFARVLRAVPGSTLAIKSLASHVPAAQVRIREWFAAQGVAPERIEFRPPAPHLEYLADYAHIDVALDPFPYNGNTSSNDALYMGVPVVTLEGDNAISRTGASLLTHLGRPEWVARGEEDYVRIAAALVNDGQRLAAIRAGLRAEMEASQLMDGPGLARALEAAFRDMWRRWCAAQR
jgi:protein O-GlcNAc transferase